MVEMSAEFLAVSALVTVQSARYEDPKDRKAMAWEFARDATPDHVAGALEILRDPATRNDPWLPGAIAFVIQVGELVGEVEPESDEVREHREQRWAEIEVVEKIVPWKQAKPPDHN